MKCTNHGQCQECHYTITEAENIQDVMAQRDKLLRLITGDCNYCKNQNLRHWSQREGWGCCSFHEKWEAKT